MKHIIKRPIITEQSYHEAARGVFTFEVDHAAGKSGIKHAIERLYNVHVTDTHTSVIKGKTRVVGKKRIRTVHPDSKKARVRLAKGESIPAFAVTESGGAQ